MSTNILLINLFEQKKLSIRKILILKNQRKTNKVIIEFIIK